MTGKVRYREAPPLKTFHHSSTYAYICTSFVIFNIEKLISTFYYNFIKFSCTPCEFMKIKETLTFMMKFVAKVLVFVSQ